MNNYLFIDNFYKVAHNLLYSRESQNNKKWPNKNNDVITDLGGGGNFPMFRYTPPHFFSTPGLLACSLRYSFPWQRYHARCQIVGKPLMCKLLSALL